ncbi:MAG: hypothetical protein BWY06_03318 [Candidatus Latescibacteria bacterium ADurb.Bin168]|nr:MAG: hypothetical protein BWY06_03318 [Candidatus Latescibacteria bacterium ADurb.Bin168]
MEPDVVLLARRAASHYLRLKHRRSAQVLVGFLSTNPHPLIKTAVEVLRRFELVVCVRDERRAVSLFAEKLRKCVLFLIDRTPPRRSDEIPLQRPMAMERKHSLSGMQRPPHRERRQALGIRLGEQHTFPRDCVKVGRVDPRVAVGADMVFPERVQNDKHEVHGSVSSGVWLQNAISANMTAKRVRRNGTPCNPKGDDREK